LALLAVPAATQAQTIFGLSGTDLTSANLASPATSQMRVAITGVTAGQTLVGIDFRPATGELFALGYDASTTGNNARLYVLNQTTAVATPVGTSAIRLDLGGSSDRIAFDFNPTVDRIRVAGTNDKNYRLNPNNGALVTQDGSLAYVTGDANAGQDPFIGTAAYTNSFIGTASTTLYYIDEQRSLLVRSDNPNGGSLATVVAINPTAGGNATPINAPGASTDLDIYTFGPNDQQAYLNVNQVDGNGNYATFLYRLNLATGATTFSGAVTGAGVGTTDIAVRIDRTAPAPSGRLLYAVSGNSNLLSFYSGTPGFINSAVAITGIASGQTLVGTDFRPNTGQLFGLGYNTSTGESRLYTIDLTTAVATPVGSGPITLALGDATDNIGFDFNPTVDRIRVVSTNRADYRLNPNNGALAFMDGALTYASTDANAGQTPRIGAVGYTNSYPGSTGTTLYDIDEARNTLATQNPPNAGTLNTVGTLGSLSLSSANALVDLDVYFDRTSLTNEAYLTANPGGQGTSNLYTLALASGTPTLVGAIGLGIPVRDISAQLAGADATAALTGRLLYGVAGGNLVSFDSGNPTVIRTAVNITGLPSDGSQVLVGADFRPFDGSLFALGYNASTQQGQLYSLSVSTGALTMVGPLQALPLGTTASAIGFDFNPTVDRIRITSASNQANLRMNPADGSFLTDVNLTNPDNANAPALAGVAYTNNDNNANTGTMLYGYDQTANVLTLATVASGAPAGTNAANAGTYRNVGSSGLNVGPGVDFDIFSDLSNATNTGYLVAAPSGTTTDNLYTIALSNGVASLVGRIGSGSNLTGLAAFLTPGPVVSANLTWTGAVSTDWGTAGNWSPNQVPTAASNVTIPDVANDPVVSGNQLANTLTLNTGAVLTLADLSVLTVSGNITNNSATIAASGQNVTGRITLNGTAAQTISGTLTTFPNLTVGSAGAAIGGPVAIRRGLVLNGTFTTSNQTLTLLSDNSGTAYVVNIGSAVVNGPATVQRYITPNLNAGPGYRHYSSPVSGNTVADLATSGFAPVVNPAYNSSATPPTVTPFPNVYSYDQSRLGLTNSSPEFDKGFQSPAATTDALEAGRGYTVNINASQLVDFTGTLNNGVITRGGLTRGTQATAGYHLLGNPYPGAIDYDVVLAASTGVESALYVYKSSGQYSGTYTSYVNGQGANTGTGILPVAQGFFVRSATGQTGSVNFANAARINVDDNTPFQRTAANTRPRLALSLRNATATAANQAVVYFEQGATASFDAKFDAHYLPATNGLLLATAADTEALAIDGRPALTGTEVTVPLLVAAAATGAYALQVDELANLPTGYFAYLRDGLTGTYTSLTAGTSLPLTLAANAATGGRYAVVFTTQPHALAAAPAALAQQVGVYPNPATSAVTIELPATLGRTAVAATLTDALGRQVRAVTLPAQGPAAHQFDLHQLAPGVYALRLTTSAGVLVRKLVVK
jgi:hypothetical protein